MSVEIEQELLDNIKNLAGGATQDEAVHLALREWLRLQKIRQLSKEIEERPFEFEKTAEELRKLNQARGV